MTGGSGRNSGAETRSGRRLHRRLAWSGHAGEIPAGLKFQIRSTSYKASHHDQDIVFANRAGALVNYSGICAGEPAFENTLAECSIEGGL
jgi:hypothetical protein